MGVEDFQVIIEGGEVSTAAACRRLESTPGVCKDAQRSLLASERYFVWSDGLHLVEIEVSEAATQEAAPSTRISCRFAICHPATVDAAFGAFIRSHASEIKLPIRIADEVPESCPFDFLPPAYENFEGVLQDSIELKRRLWIRQFGRETACLSCAEAVRRFMAGELP